MIAVKGIYDGEKFIALEDFPKNKSYKVVITFLEELDEDQEIRDFTAQTDGLPFWASEQEDLYQDYLKGNSLRSV